MDSNFLKLKWGERERERAFHWSLGSGFWAVADFNWQIKSINWALLSDQVELQLRSDLMDSNEMNQSLNSI